MVRTNHVTTCPKPSVSERMHERTQQSRIAIVCPVYLSSRSVRECIARLTRSVAPTHSISFVHERRLDSTLPAAPSESEKTDGSNLTNETRHGT